MKGIIFANKKTDYLYPIVSNNVNKYTLPIYDKPMIYYPMSTLISCGISEICIISCSQYLNTFREIFDDGSHLGLKIEYRAQYQDKGITECFLIAEDFIKNEIVGLISADNIFHGMSRMKPYLEGAIMFGYNLKKPEFHNFFTLDEEKNIKIISSMKNINNEEYSGEIYKNKYSIPDLYFFDNNVTSILRGLMETIDSVQMIDILQEYLNKNTLKGIPFPKGNVWMDCKTIQDIYHTSSYIQAIQNRQGNYVGCVEEQCLFQKYIDHDKLNFLIEKMQNSEYKNYLKAL